MIRALILVLFTNVLMCGCKPKNVKSKHAHECVVAGFDSNADSLNSQSQDSLNRNKH